MLVLTRRLNEEIVVNEDITIKVIQVGRNKVRLGIEVPSDMAIKRVDSGHCGSLEGETDLPDLKQKAKT